MQKRANPAPFPPSTVVQFGSVSFFIRFCPTCSFKIVFVIFYPLVFMGNKRNM